MLLVLGVRSATLKNMQKMYKTCKNCTLNTIHYGGNIHHFFYFFGYLLFFPRTYMKNKIGILENDIYIFPIVNSVILLIW